MNGNVLDNLKASMVPVKGGTFFMGDLKKMYNPLLGPKIHSVLVYLDDFHICSHVVTQEEWGAVMEEEIEPANARIPAVGHNWHQAQEFIGKLNSATQMSFRLPTEAEWEYAARGGEFSEGTVYAGNDILDLMGWYNVNSEGVMHSICQKSPNQLGLFDMCGNVWEWCQDLYEKYYKIGPRKGMFSRERLPVENPKGGLIGNKRVIRGGSYLSDSTQCWLFYRNKVASLKKIKEVGFRLAY